MHLCKVEYAIGLSQKSEMHHHNRQLPAHACYLQVGSALALAASPLAAV
jgi:hypothetical protein